VSGNARYLPRFTAVGAVLAVAAIVGCGTSLMSVPDPTPATIAVPASFEATSKPTVSPQATASTDGEPSPGLTLTDDERREQAVSGPRFGRCSNFSTIVDEGEATIELAVLWADATIVADIREIGGGRYNLPSGELTGERPVGWYDVYRPTIVDVVTVVQGDAAEGALKVRLPGGRLGCDTYDLDRTHVVDRPGPFVLFLSWEPDVRGNEVAEMTIVRAWRIDGQNEVVTPYDGNVPVEEFIVRGQDGR